MIEAAAARELRTILYARPGYAGSTPRPGRMVYAKLLDEGVYLGSVSTMYRVLRDHDEIHERRRHATHPAATKPLAFCRRFFCWYNEEHRHSGIGFHTPADVPTGGPSRSGPSGPSCWTPPTPPTPSGPSASPGTTGAANHRLDQPAQGGNTQHNESLINLSHRGCQLPVRLPVVGHGGRRRSMHPVPASEADVGRHRPRHHQHRQALRTPHRTAAAHRHQRTAPSVPMCGHRSWTGPLPPASECPALRSYLRLFPLDSTPLPRRSHIDTHSVDLATSMSVFDHHRRGNV